MKQVTYIGIKFRLLTLTRNISLHLTYLTYLFKGLKGVENLNFRICFIFISFISFFLGSSSNWFLKWEDDHEIEIVYSIIKFKHKILIN